jgi:hypothetical protein
MHGLAFLAAMLLAFAPSISKFASASPSTVLEAVCTSDGLKTVELAAEGIAPDDQTGHPDCSYSTLLTWASAAPPSVAMAIPALDLSPEKAGHSASPHLAKSNFPALGSRGPPAV